MDKSMYAYYVHNFSNLHSLQECEAYVQIYDSEGLVHDIRIPTSGSGSYWDVLSIDGSTGDTEITNRVREHMFPQVSPLLGRPHAPGVPFLQVSGDLTKNAFCAGEYSRTTSWPEWLAKQRDEGTSVFKGGRYRDMYIFCSQRLWVFFRRAEDNQSGSFRARYFASRCHRVGDTW
jgi:hypothetical protein